MDDRHCHIAVVEPSSIIFEGLSNVLYRGLPAIGLYRLGDIHELELVLNRHRLNIVIINPLYIQSDKKHFLSLRQSKAGLQWIGLVYSFFDKDLLGLFDNTIQITDSPEVIISKLRSTKKPDHQFPEEDKTEPLSERELDVLGQLARGLSNKEIADKLNISIHTVISHRKNITHKTGIRSQAGLTIFAISNKIISLEDFPG